MRFGFEKLVFCFVVSQMIYVAPAFPWGAAGHEIVARLGAENATAGKVFWRAHTKSIEKISNVPDRLWKKKPTIEEEKPLHWFHIDTYSGITHILSQPTNFNEFLQLHGQDSITANGTAPWRIRQLYEIALEALIRRDDKTAVQAAGAMIHYIGDLAQPLHVTENYDGELSGQKGIHFFFETKIIPKGTVLDKSVRKQQRIKMQNSAFADEFSGTLVEDTFLLGDRALQKSESVLKTDRELGRDEVGKQAQVKIAIERLADGAASVSIILGQLWKDSGRESFSTMAPVADPDWIPPQFMAALRTERNTLPSFDDDCGADESSHGH